MKDLNSLLAGKASLIKIAERYKAKLEMAQKELNDIEIALSILQKYGVDVSEGVQIPPKTVGEMAIQILKERPDGLTANQILDIIRERWIPELMRSSMSPPLSRLKHMGVIQLDGSIWKIIEKPSFLSSQENKED